MSTTMMIILLIAIAAVAVGILIYIKNEKSRKLRVRFGPEYERLMAQEGNTRKAEAILDERQKRVEKFSIRPLSRADGDQFAVEWQSIQSRFVDDPRTAVSQADSLVNRALLARGYPMGDFEQRAADLSVEHPQVVENYRIAHDIALRDQRERATTEELRRAMQHYRNLFENLLERRVTAEYAGPRR